MSYVRSEEAPTGNKLFPGMARLLECQLHNVNVAAQKAEHLSKYADEEDGEAQYTADRLILMAGHLKEGVILTYVDDRGYYGEALFKGEMNDPFLICGATMETLALEPGITLIDTLHLHAGLVTHINRIPVEILDEVHPDRLLPITRKENCERMNAALKQNKLHDKMNQIIELTENKPITRAALRAAVERCIASGVAKHDDFPSEIFTYETREQLIARGVDVTDESEAVDIRVLEI